MLVLVFEFEFDIDFVDNYYYDDCYTEMLEGRERRDKVGGMGNGMQVYLFFIC